MTTYLTNKLIYVHGVQRTGQHAIIAWLIGHFNNVCFRNGIPRKHKINLISPWWYFDLKERPDFKWEKSSDELIRKNQDVIIFGVEYQNLNLRDMKYLEEEKKEMANKLGCDEFAKETIHIGVIRTPWNHWASIQNWKRRWWLKKKERFIACWKMMAKEYIGKTDILPSPKIFIKYDDWFSNKKYREKISKGIGIPFSDRGLNVVMKIGVGVRFGSSFNGMNFEEEAQKMKVLDRWRVFEKDAEFIKVLTMDKDVINWSKKIFGYFPEELENHSLAGRYK